ncbi:MULTISPECIES: hypothetical protein [unclassified Streptomyces]|uniref:hypothetical protein n=1 Tax=unclassified Streptomyces TaxID=2593676 RepID=UPI0022552AA6|nr:MULTISPECIES: hypothetical protein [unclassified Streptomyces]MCX4827847.1 hypothetical protein [Streptomyces sp. NBC_01016]
MPTTDPVQLVRDAAESLRAFNHRTFPGGDRPGLASVPEAYRVLGALTALVERLPQAFEQIDYALNTHHRLGHVSADYGTTTEHVTAASASLHEAEDYARGLTAALNRAWSATNPLGHTGPIPS